jgi:hypothetical protein
MFHRNVGSYKNTASSYHRKQYSSCKFGGFTAVTMKNAVFWGLTPCGGSGKKRRFAGTYRLHHQGDKNGRARNVSSNYKTKHSAKKRDVPPKRRSTRRHTPKHGFLLRPVNTNRGTVFSMGSTPIRYIPGCCKKLTTDV